jgi:hypothetical protein
MLRGVPLEELRTSKLWRADQAAWFVRLLRPAAITLAASVMAVVVLLVLEAL